MRPARTNGLAAIWGAAEATVFFIVPDVLLSWIALRSLRSAFIASLWTLAGALVGGTFVWVVAQTHADVLRDVYAALPAIDAGMIADVAEQLQTDGLLALFIGPLTGTPYKLYTLEAATQHFGLAAFLLVSIPARLARFLVVSLLVHTIGRCLGGFASQRQLRWLLALAWIAFYAWFFLVMGDPNQA